MPTASTLAMSHQGPDLSVASGAQPVWRRWGVRGALVVAVLLLHVVAIEGLLHARKSSLAQQALPAMLVTLLDAAASQGGPAPAEHEPQVARQADRRAERPIQHARPAQAVTPAKAAAQIGQVPTPVQAQAPAKVPALSMSEPVQALQNAPSEHTKAPIAAPPVPGAEQPGSTSQAPATEASLARASSGGSGSGDAGQPLKLPSASLRYLVVPKPEYPAASRDLGESGVVLLKVLIDEQGRPQEVDVARSSGFPRLDQQAVLAMRAARFQPRVVDGVARSVITTAALRFNLEE